jgi:ubiquinone/menaquinone biosynthesis C-methylase UbiE
MVTHNLNDKNKAWDDYWRQSGDNGKGCLPSANDVVDGALNNWWRNFGKSLPRKARHIDLASGNGIVIKKLLKTRPDLKSVGIDSATSLPLQNKGFKLRGGISMESMPFPDNSVDAITSQFGIEYGNMEKAAAEVARLLKSGGQFSFIIHKADGPIVVQNNLRLESMRWVLTEQQLLLRARKWLAQKNLLGANIPSDFVNAPHIAAAKFGATSAAAEIATALAQCLAVGANLSLAENVAMLDDLMALANGEILRIQSLTDAAKDGAEILAFCAMLNLLNLVVELHIPFSQFMPKCDDFAWIISGQKVIE